MPICRIDIPAGNFDKIKKFYHGVFGWTFEKVEGSSESWSIDFGPDLQSVLITGNIIPRSAPTQPIGCYFPVNSIDELSARIQELSGIVFVPKTAVTGKGYYACCLDPENNYFVLWEDDERA